MARVTKTLLMTVSAMALASTAHGEEGFLENWSIDATNTARVDHYDIDGNALASPFPFDDTHAYNEFNINASRQYSPYERLRINAFGVINASDYRGVDDGIVPERFNILYENGEGAVPYRAQAGDFFAGLSYRTLQRTLKGASLELQPFGSRERSHSLMFFSGTNQPTYRSFDPTDDYYTGFSWLVEDRNWGRASFNVVNAQQDEANGALLGTDNSQMLYSAAFEAPFELMSQRLTFEGELGFFDGDYGTLEDQNDVGAFSQLTGRSSDIPLDYRLRYERYGQHYRPNGAIIVPDRESYEAHAGWRFEQGTYLRARAQRFNDAFDSGNEQRTQLIGTNLSGPILIDFVPGMTGNIDLYQQQIDNDSNTIDRDTDVLNASLTAPIYNNWNGQVNVFLQDADDRLASDLDSAIRQVGFGVFVPVTLGDLSGTINPGFVLREVDFDGSADSIELNPTINATLSNETHRLNANYGLLNQNRIDFGASDIATQTAGLEYAYSIDQHELGFSGAYYDRDIDAALDTDAWRMGVYWTVRFNRPARASAATRQASVVPAAGAGIAPPPITIAGLGLITDLQPGDSLARASSLIAEQDITGPLRQSGLVSYETTLLSDVIERQRLVLEHGSGTVKKAALVIDVTDTGSPRSVEQLYARVQQHLVRQYGQPDTIFEQGEFSGNIVSDINSDRVIRVNEWQTANGVLRFGVPRRVDGQIRLELQHAKRFASPRDTLWSVKLF